MAERVRVTHEKHQHLELYRLLLIRPAEICQLWQRLTAAHGVVRIKRVTEICPAFQHTVYKTEITHLKLLKSANQQCLSGTL